jgi:hypothetical protein
MRANGFTHVSVHAYDLEESARFYMELFEMEEIPTPADVSALDRSVAGETQKIGDDTGGGATPSYLRQQC